MNRGIGYETGGEGTKETTRRVGPVRRCEEEVAEIMEGKKRREGRQAGRRVG